MQSESRRMPLDDVKYCRRAKDHVVCGIWPKESASRRAQYLWASRGCYWTDHAGEGTGYDGRLGSWWIGLFGPHMPLRPLVPYPKVPVEKNYRLSGVE
jgi:hypothetical protein